ncbi:MAG TPA: MlaD family protein [Baekduia sp.]|nr:MlaD family protein [Baekduia sp.]
MRRVGAVLALAVAVVAAGLALGGRGERDAYLIRAVFANAFGITPGLEVKVAGVAVGAVDRLEVTPEGAAAVVLRIDDPAFRDFRADARCAIRPQSLLGERFVACTPTQPRRAATRAAPPLRLVQDGRPGAGQRLLPRSRTTQPVDPDLLLATMRLPQRERLRLVLGELGVALSGRGGDLREALRRADPAFDAADRVLRVVARQTRALEQLAEDADAALGPVARDRREVAAFVRHAARVSQVGAGRRAEIERSVAALPRLLRELPATLDDARRLSVRATPLARDLRLAAPGVRRLVAGTPALAAQLGPALEGLGEVADAGGPVLRRARPVIADLRRLGDAARPVAADLGALSRSLDDNGIARQLVDVLFTTVMSSNGYDAAGHYLRAGLIVNNCSTYAIESSPDCAATFEGRGREPLLELLLGRGR